MCLVIDITHPKGTNCPDLPGKGNNPSYPPIPDDEDEDDSGDITYWITAHPENTLNFIEEQIQGVTPSTVNLTITNNNADFLASIQQVLRQRQQLYNT